MPAAASKWPENLKRGLVDRGTMVKKGPTNPVLVKTLQSLRSTGYGEEKGIWVDVAERLGRPTRRRAEVNVSKLARYCKDGETVIVPGKVLSSGSLGKKKLNVAAWAFSKEAREKITASGGKCMAIEDLLGKKVSGFRIME